MKTEQRQPEEFTDLYPRAFASTVHKRPLETPTPEDALVVARALRIEVTARPGSVVWAESNFRFRCYRNPKHK